MSAGGSKRAVAEIRFGEDRAGVAKVGGRSIHQYWSMLQPHFRDVFLAPQRRSDDGGVSWTWREPEEKQTLTAAELAGVRSRLERAKVSFEENPVNPLMSEASSQEIIDQLTVRVTALADGLAGKPDAALAEFVCRTEAGAMVHSWGLTAAAKISYPDSMESGVSGVVVFGGKGSAGNDVAIENARGLRVARTTTDEAGQFNFGKLTPGRYRVRVISGPGEYSAKGTTVNVERGETARISLRSTSDPEAPGGEGNENAGESGGVSDTAVPVTAKKRRAASWVAMVVLLLLIGGGVWIWLGYFRSGADDSRTMQRISTLTPEKFSPAKSASNVDATTKAGGATGAGLGAEADGQGKTSSPVLRRETPAIGGPAFSKDAGSATASVSKIGTRVELSGVNTPGAGSGSSANFSNSAGRGATTSTGSNSTAAEKSPASTDLAASGELAGPEGDAKKRSTTSGASAASSDKAHAVGGAETEALAGHAPAGLGGAMPGSPAGSEPEKKPGLGNGDGSVLDRAKAVSGKSAVPAVAVRAKDGASSDSAAAVSDGKAGASGGAGGLSGGAQGPVAAVSVVEKPASNSGAPPGGEVGQPAESSEENSNQDSPAAEQSGDAAKAKSKNASKTTSQPGASGVSAGGAGGSAGAGSVPSQSANASAATAGSLGEAESAATANKQSPQAVGAASAAAGSEKPVSSPEQPSLSKPERTARAGGFAPSRPLPAGMQFMGAVRLGGWSLRVGRDVIVPTLPVREGEKDLAEAMRRKLIEEQKARLPETLRGPSLQCGFAFKFAAGAKAQPLRWSVERFEGLVQTARDARAELGWNAAAMPREGVMTLTYADGTEVARIEFGADGRASVALRPELRASLWLGAIYAETDVAREGSVARLTWQVVRGPLASSAWSFENRWLDGAGCRLEVVLNGANPATTRIALVDQASSWQLATELE